MIAHQLQPHQIDILTAHIERRAGSAAYYRGEPCPTTPGPARDGWLKALRFEADIETEHYLASRGTQTW